DSIVLAKAATLSGAAPWECTIDLATWPVTTAAKQSTSSAPPKGPLMPELAVNAGTIHYQEFGHGIPVVLTTGGRWAGYVQRVVATELAKDFRVFTWDRRNTDGKSDITIA